MLKRFELEDSLIDRVIDGYDDIDWYTEAQQWCGVVAARFGISVAQVAGIVAALSPQRKWEINTRQTVEFLQAFGEVYLHYGTQVHKAQAILAGADPDKVLTGPKENCFYHNLMGAIDTVTIDRHMMTALGMGGKRLTKTRFEFAKEKLEEIAAAFGLDAPQVQAAIWATLAW